jgi:hypothetical protein
VRAFSVLLGLGLLGALIGLNQWALQAIFDVSYVKWSLENGFIVTALASAAFAIVDRDSNRNLISAHPALYLGTCMAFVAGPLLLATSTSLRRSEGRESSVLDSFLAIPVALLLAVAGLLWLLLVVPIQYVVILVCGAPARLSAASEWRAVGHWKDGRYTVDEMSKAKPLPPGAVDLSLGQKPVSVTNAIASIVLFGVSLAL